MIPNGNGERDEEPMKNNTRNNNKEYEKRERQGHERDTITHDQRSNPLSDDTHPPQKGHG